MKKLVFLFAACFFMQSIVSYAQLSTGESPVSFSLHQINWRVPAVTLPALDMATSSSGGFHLPDDDFLLPCNKPKKESFN